MKDKHEKIDYLSKKALIISKKTGYSFRICKKSKMF